MRNPLSCHVNVLVAGVDDPGLPAALDTIAAAGFAYVGLPPLAGAEIPAATLRRRIEAAGLRPVVFAMQRADADVSSADRAIGAAGAGLLRSALDLAVELGAAHITGVPYAAFGRAAAWTVSERDRSAAAVARFADAAAEAGIAVTFEVLNRYESSAINTVRQAVDYIAASGSAALRMHLDAFHMMIEESDPAGALAEARGRIGFLEFGQSGRGSLATGGVDVSSVVREAVAAGYGGPIAFEAFSRATLSPAAADRLRVWRDVAEDGGALVREAAAVLRGAVSAADVARESEGVPV